MPRALSRTLRGELVAVLVLLAAATAVFWTTGLDLAAADAFREPCCRWPVSERPFWDLVYRHGVLAGVLLAAASLVTFTLSYWYPRRLHAARRPALFLVVVAVIGPGLLVNVVLKDNYGRPRPREVVELGGQERFLPVWVKGDDRQAKSFPCGHCSMGFYLGVPWLVLKRRRRALGLAFLGASAVMAGLLGVARMAAGGHFLSDVVWAGGIVWLVAIALHHAMDLDRVPDPAAAPAARDLRKARRVTLAGGAALAALTVAVLLATPYLSEKTFTLRAADLAALGPRPLEIALDEASVTVAAGPELAATYRVQAFGFPTSRQSWSFRPAAGEADPAVLRIDRLGFFTERRTAVTLRLPADGARPVRLRLGRGKVAVDPAGFPPGAGVEVIVDEGEITVAGGGPAALAPASGISARVTRGRVVGGG
jgi:membrane-associated PAP2 superfamily phosphatase